MLEVVEFSLLILSSPGNLSPGDFFGPLRPSLRLFSILPLASASGEQSPWVSALAEKPLKTGSLHKQNESRL